MEKVEIIAITGNKFQVPGGVNNQKIYKRIITIQNTERDDEYLRIFFDNTEKEKLYDFVNRMNHLGGSESYYLHFISNDKWIESRIIENETDLVVNFSVFREDVKISGNILEI